MQAGLEEKAKALCALLEAHADAVDFAPFGEGTSDDWIAKAEGRLQVTFPPSYKWWLKNFGGGTLYGDEIFSIYEMDFDTVVGGDVVYMNEMERKEAQLPADNLLIYNTDQGESYFIALGTVDEASESPVFLTAGEQSHAYAPDFIAFLTKQLVAG